MQNRNEGPKGSKEACRAQRRPLRPKRGRRDQKKPVGSMLEVGAQGAPRVLAIEYDLFCPLGGLLGVFQVTKRAHVQVSWVTPSEQSLRMQGGHGQGGDGHLGWCNCIVDCLAVWQAASQAGRLPTKSKSQGEVKGKPWVANLASNFSQIVRRRDLRNYFTLSFLPLVIYIWL